MDRVRSRRGVRETYDRIAAHFARTRTHPWEDVTDFIERSENGRSAGNESEDEGERAGDGRIGLDVGCGNGRHAGSLAERVERVLGVDASAEVLGEARKRAAESGYDGALALVQSDAARLPLGSGRIDLALSIATVHHLPDREARIASLEELARVLAPGGRALVSVWSVSHDRFDRLEGFDATIDWTLPDGETVPRYYHIYDLGEFDRDLAASNLDIERTYRSHGNCFGEVSASE